MYNALEACAEHLEQFGGHKYAAGMTLKEENYQNFKDAFDWFLLSLSYSFFLICDLNDA